MKMPKFEADLQNKETIDYPKDAVGYTVTHPDGTLSESFFTVITDKTFENDDVIFLYTHPAKTLTDEEILDALQDALNGWKYIRECHGDLYGVGWDRVQDKIEAILRKAQENG